MKIVAHRGYSARFPENSLLAFERAAEAGADWVETDLRRSADGVLVCWHDPDLERVTGVATEIARTSAAVLTSIALPGAARVHRLAEVLACVRGRVPAMLDVKIEDDHALRAPIVRVTGRDTPIPFADSIEKGVWPEIEDVVTAIRSVMAWQ